MNKLSAILLVLCLLAACAVAPRTPLAPKTYDITYKIGGNTSAAGLTYQNAQDATEQRDVDVPWELNFTAAPGQFLYLSAQNNNDWGSITCQILVNGVVAKEATSSGAYKIASCSGRL